MRDEQRASWSGLLREKGREHLRQILLRSYRIVHRVGAKRVEVLTVFEGHRALPDDVK